VRVVVGGPTVDAQGVQAGVADDLGDGDQVLDPVPQEPPSPVRGPLARRGRAWSRSFTTRALADGFRPSWPAEHGIRSGHRAAGVLGHSRHGHRDWLEHAACYAAMKWPHLAAHTRAGIADALATITPALIADAARRPPASALRSALYGLAFNLGRSGSQPPVEIARVLAWARRHSLPLASLAEPVVARHALHAITRKRAVFHNALGYAAELGLLPANPLSQIAWRSPHPCAAGMAPGADDLTYLGSAVFQRIMRTLQARDDLLRAMNRKQDIDVAEDALIALDTCLVFPWEHWTLLPALLIAYSAWPLATSVGPDGKAVAGSRTLRPRRHPLQKSSRLVRLVATP
jgi:hypothetical protein